MPAKHPKKLRHRFIQGDFGLYIIRDKSGNEITIDCKDLTMSDIHAKRLRKHHAVHLNPHVG